MCVEALDDEFSAVSVSLRFPSIGGYQKCLPAFSDLSTLPNGFCCLLRSATSSL